MSCSWLNGNSVRRLRCLALVHRRFNPFELCTTMSATSKVGASYILTLPTHWTLPPRRILLDPFDDAVHVEIVPALSRHYRRGSGQQKKVCNSQHLLRLTQAALIAGEFASGACPVEVHLANTADVVVGNVPPPGGYGVPLLDVDFHAVGANLVGCELSAVVLFLDGLGSVSWGVR